jgi:hypothetical protein
MFNTEQCSNDDTTYSKVVQSISIGLSKVVLTFGTGHPFDYLKTRMQANPNIYSATLLSKEIYSKSTGYVAIN